MHWISVRFYEMGDIYKLEFYSKLKNTFSLRSLECNINFLWEAAKNLSGMTTMGLYLAPSSFRKTHIFMGRTTKGGGGLNPLNP